jgi:hypothetical protein
MFAVEGQAGFAAPELIQRLEAPACRLLDRIALAPDGTVGVIGDLAVWLCPLADPARWQRLELPIAGVTALAWSDVGDRLAFGTLDGSVGVARFTGCAGSGLIEPLWCEPVQTTAVRFLAFIASDGWLVHGDGDGAVIASDAQTGRPMRRWSGASEMVARAGDWLFAVSADSMRMWEADAADGPITDVAFFGEHVDPLGYGMGYWPAVTTLVGRGSPLAIIADGTTAFAFPVAGPFPEDLDDDEPMRATWRSEHAFVAAASCEPRALVALATEGSADGATHRAIHVYDVRPLLGQPSPDPAAVAHAIAKLRQRFLANPYEARCAWFTEFDTALRRARFDLCHALVDEIRDVAWRLSPDDLRYVASREGALLLHEAARLQCAGRFDDAERKYLQSRTVQRAAGGTDAVAQIDAMLRSMAMQRRNGRVPTALLGVAVQLKALRNPDGRPASTASASMLERALDREDTEGRRRILQAAKRERIPEVAIRALSLTADPISQARAAAVLAEFEAMPADTLQPVLSAAISGAQALVRWRALEALARTDLAADYIAPLIAAFRRETDPEALLALLRIATKVAGPAAVAAAISALSDLDADIRAEAVTTLAKIGDRQALGQLRAIAPGRPMLKWESSWQVRRQASDAEQAILARNPSPTLSGLEVRIASAPDGPRRIVYDHETIVVRGVLSATSRGGRLALCWLDGANATPLGDVPCAMLGEQRFLLADAPAGASRARSSPAIEFLDDSPATGFIAPQRTVPGPSAAVTMRRFVPGERVVLVNESLLSPSRFRTGDVGTIRTILVDHDDVDHDDIDHDDCDVAIEFDQDRGGSNLGGACADGHGARGRPSAVAPLAAEPFAIGARVIMIDESRVDRHLVPRGTKGTIMAVEQRPESALGVAWDLDIGGHALQGRCPHGYGWWVPRDAVVPAGVPISIVLGSAARLRPGCDGTLVVDMIEGSGLCERLGAIPLRRVAHAQVVAVTLHQAAGPSAEPGEMIDVVTQGLPWLYAKVRVTDVVPGVEVRARVIGPADNVVEERIAVAEVQGDVDFPFVWNTESWPGGRYQVRAEVSRGTARSASFELLRSFRIKRALTCRALGKDDAPIGQTKLFPCDAAHICVALELTGCPAGACVKIVVHRPGEASKPPVFTTTLPIWGRGDVQFGAALTPLENWEIGGYEAEVAVYAGSVHKGRAPATMIVLTFLVCPPEAQAAVATRNDVIEPTLPEAMEWPRYRQHRR